MLDFFEKFYFSQGGSVDTVRCFNSIAIFNLQVQFGSIKLWKMKKMCLKIGNLLDGNNHASFYVSRFVNGGKLFFHKNKFIFMKTNTKLISFVFSFFYLTLAKETQLLKSLVLFGLHSISICKKKI